MNTKHHQFGPWATTLHCGSRLELNAFWRRRLSRLAALGGGGRRLGVRGNILLGVFASALVVVPRVQLGPSAEVAEAKPQAAVESKQGDAAVAKKAEPFTATFSNGVGIQLVGLSTNPSRGQAWWTPDGMPLADAPYDNVRAQIGVWPDGLAREICWRWLNLPKDVDYETSWETRPANSNRGGGTAIGADGKPVEGLTAWAIGASKRDDITLVFRVKVRETPWQVVFTSEGRVMGTGRVIDGANHSAMFAQAQEINCGASITVTFQTPGKATRLVAIDEDDNVRFPTSKSGGGLNDFVQMTYQFAGVTPGRIKRFELQTQTRVFETIEFRKVSLDPREKNGVQTYRISADGKEERLDVPGVSAAYVAERQNSPEAKAANERYERSLVQLKTMADEQGYKLAAGESVKHVPPPFSKERAEIWAQPFTSRLFGATTGADGSNQPPPGFMHLWFTEGRVQPSTWHNEEPTVGRILDEMFGLKLHRVEGDRSLLTVELPGDWVANWDDREYHQADAGDIAVLERVLQEELLEVVRLELRDERRPVYVVKGDYKFTAIANPRRQTVDHSDSENADGAFQIPARRTRHSGSVVRYPEFIEKIAELILVPLVDETTTKPKKHDFFMQFNGKPPADVLKPFEPQTVDAILASVTAQTGFTFVKEERPVKMLKIQRGVRESK